MDDSSQTQQSLDDLRHRAMRRLEGVPPTDVLVGADLETLHQELSVLSIELDLQLEEFRHQRDALHRSNLARARYEDLYDFAPVGYVTLDEGGVVHEANRTLCTMLGVNRHRFQGRRFAIFLTAESRTTFAHTLARTFEEGGRHVAEVGLQRHDGTVFPARVECAPLEHPDRAVDSAEPHFCLVTLTDVTAEKAAQQALMGVNEELERRVQERTRRLRALTEHVQNFTLAVTGELTAPMRRVNAFLELLRRDGAGLNERQQEHVAHVFQSVRHMEGLVEGLREYTRLATAPLRVRPVDLNRVFHEVRKDLAPLLEGREVSLTSDPLPTVLADSLSLQVVLTKLLDNALKFTRTREVARIHVGAEERASSFVLCVEDNGVGFNNRHKSALFSVFKRLHPERDFEGHGLGLATVRQVCERLGGQVWAEGRVGEGATFFFSLPKEPTEVF